MRRAITLGALLALAAGAAWAGDSSVTVKKLGKAEVKWNSVGYSDALMAQLSPGLTWRLGKDGPTRLTVEKMALVSPQGGVLLPGEQTLNLRYWSSDSWALVVFEENEWKWAENVTEFGIFPATVGQEPDEAKAAKKLDLELRVTKRGDPMIIPRPAVTGEAESLGRLFEVPDDVEYAREVRRRWADLPWLEVRMRFGPHVGVTGFEPVRTTPLEGSWKRTDAADAKVRIETLALTATDVRSAYLEEFEGEIPVGVLFEEGGPKAGVVLFVSGGETPFLTIRTRSGEDVGEMLDGTREAAQLRKAPDNVFCAMDGSVLRVTVAPWVYAFDLAAR